MFNFFKGKDPKVYGTELAKQATLEPIYEEGRICGYSISFEKNENVILNDLKRSEIRVAFIVAIDNRILKNDYRDYTLAILDEAGLDPPADYYDLDAKRIVRSQNYELIFAWG